MRNVTISLDEEVARWARIEAARNDLSVSRFLGRLLSERMRSEAHYQKSMSQVLARPAFLKTDGKYLTRDELHERHRLR
jgi:hypothetical protein